MFRDFPLGCSWVFLLLLGSAVSRPASESDNKHPYAWGYGPRLLSDGSSGVQSDQQPSPGTGEPNDPPPDASSSQSNMPTGEGSVHPPKAPAISPRSAAHVGSPVASGSRNPASSGSFQAVPRMVGAKPRFAPGGSPNVGPAGAKYLFPGSFPQVFKAKPPQFMIPGKREPVHPGPVPPPIYIIQSNSGFMRLSHENSRSRYSPEYLEGLAHGGDPFAFLGAADQKRDHRGGLKV